MILTGKALEGFQDWYTEKYKQFNTSYVDDIHLFALIIEWLDSVGIMIFIDPNRFNNDFVFTATIYHENHRSSQGRTLSTIDNFNSRQEATKQAIIKANQIYNSL